MAKERLPPSRGHDLKLNPLDGKGVKNEVAPFTGA